ncbi:hypothetical protein FE257_005699 [Aspergillus nanangensis]|uniref:Uncharacterized protein n=1 Tax=Aspergillus nanangensis TaxID=2582783 RepID=A0AAD4CRP6_ASPNN|nr:hypothetical protein FE257_005699 [Aspergillus nanangensis]
MRFLLSAVFVVGCLGAPILPLSPLVSKEQAEGMTQDGDVAVCDRLVSQPNVSIIPSYLSAQANQPAEPDSRSRIFIILTVPQSRGESEEPSKTTEGNVSPTNDGTVNNNVSFLRLC